MMRKNFSCIVILIIIFETVWYKKLKTIILISISLTQSLNLKYFKSQSRYLVQRCRLYKAIYGVAKIGSTLDSYLYILLTCDINLNLIWILTVCWMSYVVVNLSLFVVICTARQGFLFCNKVIIIYIFESWGHKIKELAPSITKPLHDTVEDQR